MVVNFSLKSIGNTKTGDFGKMCPLANTISVKGNGEKQRPSESMPPWKNYGKNQSVLQRQDTLCGERKEISELSPESVPRYRQVADSLAKEIDTNVKSDSADALASFLMKTIPGGIYKAFGTGPFSNMAFSIESGIFNCQNISILMKDAIMLSRFASIVDCRVASAAENHVALVISGKKNGKEICIDPIREKEPYRFDRKKEWEHLPSSDKLLVQYLVNLNLGVAYVDYGDYSAALEHLRLVREAAADAPSFPIIMYQAYDGLYAQDSTQQSLDSLNYYKKKVIRYEPNYFLGEHVFNVITAADNYVQKKYKNYNYEFTVRYLEKQILGEREKKKGTGNK